MKQIFFLPPVKMRTEAKRERGWLGVIRSGAGAGLALLTFNPFPSFCCIMSLHFQISPYHKQPVNCPVVKMKMLSKA